MARMIPPVIPASCSSLGEKEIFLQLRDDPDTTNWVVLHSLDIAQHVRQISGEADFVIIVPSLGVLCLEVKGCHSLRRDNGLWFYGRDPAGDPRGPFKQASQAMHSLRKRISQKEQGLSRVPFCSAVAFPFVKFSSVSSEWHAWQIIDAGLFKQHSIANIIANVLRNARKHMETQLSSKWFIDREQLPTLQQVTDIVKILRPNFEFLENKLERRLRSQAEIIRYTEEQFAALDMMEDNPRVLFTGPAGTGKTILALEAARRAAYAGKKVLLVCFNRLLGQWITQSNSVQNDQITTSTFHQFMVTLTGITPPKSPNKFFWMETVPEAALSRLLNSHDEIERFDVVVVDEIQDLVYEPYLDVLDLVLKGGLINGSWRIFGDFERQVLYGQSREQIDNLLKMRLGSFAKGALRINCRNTPRIAAISQLLGQLSPNYSRILRSDDRIEPIIRYYATPSQQRKEIVKAIESLYKESYCCDDIVILSPKASPRCAAADITEKPWCTQLAPFENASASQVRYTTVQRFKGLESAAVIVTDIEHMASELFSSLFYVATTRALERLYIIAHETVKSDIIEILLCGKK